MEANYAKERLEIPVWRSVLVLVLGGLTFLACLLSPPPQKGAQAGLRMELPNFVGEYLGTDADVGANVRKILPDDTEFARKIYVSTHQDQIDTQIVLAGAEKRSIHRPEICLRGQGWTITSGEVIKVSLKNGKVLPVMTLSLWREAILRDGSRKKVRSYFMYWFVGRDTVTSYHWKRIFLTSWDRLVHNKTHRWAYVLVSAPVTGDLSYHGKSPEETLEMLKGFIGDLAPRFIDEKVF